MNKAQHYRRLRTLNPNVPAHYVLDWAREEVELDEMERRCDWDFIGNGRTIARGAIDGCVIVAYVDDEPYDWGDIEPTEQEQRDLEVIGVAVRLAGDDDDLDAIWSVDYFDGDWERAALRAALHYGFIQRARTEAQERAEWAARDTITVEA